MTTTVTPRKQCPTCGKPLPQGSPAGLCPSCLLAQGAETDPGGPEPKTRFEPPALEEVAALFPQLEVISLLGAGGMGAVYKARQPELDRFVALKLLPKDGAEENNFAERFNREARAMARLSHPNIVGVHEFGQAGGLFYFLMEFVDGANLRQLGQAGRMSAREALQIIPQICDALQYAHDEGVVHRDIKPENVLVDRKGRVKIADFGLAKILGHDAEAGRLTVEGQVMGTPHYMAPEQVERPMTVDHRADIYALGVVFYELLTGDLPIGKFQPPSRKVQVDVRLDEIVLRALENDPDRRYQRASEVKSRVETVTGTPGQMSTPGTDAEPETPGVRHLRWAGIPVVVERDGEREVSFNGALGVVAAVLFTTAAGMGLVHLVSGREHVIPRLCYFIAGWTAFLAIRSTLNRKKPVPERAANGTVILPPPKRFPYLRHQLVLAAVFLAVVGTHFLKLNVLNPMLGIQSPGALVQARRDPASGVMRVEVPGRGHLELLAVSRAGSAPNQWWRPDGRPATNASFEVHALGNVGRDAGPAHVFIVRALELPDGAEGPFLAASEPDATMTSGGTVFDKGKRLAGGHAMVLALRNPGRVTALRAGLTLEPRRPVFSYDPQARRTTTSSLPGDPRWQITMHGETDTPNGAHITMVMPRVSSDWQVQILAVDLAGQERTERMVSGTGTPSGGESIWTCSFPKLLLKDVKEFRVAVRRVQWFEFQGVELEPKSVLPTAKPLKFGDVVSLMFDELIDFDTGKAMKFSANGIGESDLWARQQGFDALAREGHLEILNTEFGTVQDSDWDTLTPQQVVDSVYSSRFAPNTLKPLTGALATRTFSYQTREGGFGLIRLEGFANCRPGVTLSIKPVKR